MSITLEKKLGFGAMHLPLTGREDSKSIDLAQFQQMADLFLERGFCYFDTAYPYHDGYSEEAVRQCVVERYPRESFLLADKMPILQVKAPECLKCGLCAKNCPQHIAIRDMLEEFVALYEN